MYESLSKFGFCINFGVNILKEVKKNFILRTWLRAFEKFGEHDLLFRSVKNLKFFFIRANNHTLINGNRDYVITAISAISEMWNIKSGLNFKISCNGSIQSFDDW